MNTGSSSIDAKERYGTTDMSDDNEAALTEKTPVPPAPADSSQTMTVGEMYEVSGGWFGPFPTSSNPGIVQITMINIGTEPDYLMSAVAVGTAVVTLQYQNGSTSKITVTVVAA
jgi:hypothetical protein